MKRNHSDDIGNKNKRFSFPNDRPPPGPSSNPYGGYAYQPPPPMNWGDPRNQHKEHTNIGMYSQPPPMMQWNNASPSPNNIIYNPLQPPPPPLPLERPPM